MDPNPYASPQQPNGLSSSAKAPARTRKPFHWVLMEVWLGMIAIVSVHAGISYLQFRTSGFRGGAGLPAPIYWALLIGYPILMGAISVYHIVRAWRGLPEHWTKPKKK